MSRRKKLVTTTLREDQAENLRLLSKQTRIPQAVHIRDALDLYLAKFPWLFEDSKRKPS